jgi:hypothetical protein
LCDGEVVRIDTQAVVLGQRTRGGALVETARSLRPE